MHNATGGGVRLDIVLADNMEANVQQGVVVYYFVQLS